VIIAYGVESVVPGVHDAFHDFRHVIGMACH
ncbi:MAG: CbtB-domain containing protein, partial [Deltaproteobacteria bacterium]|nr:CbtB-domain containing protein [Deltaproteobacteria bacterium]